MHSHKKNWRQSNRPMKQPIVYILSIQRWLLLNHQTFFHPIHYDLSPDAYPDLISVGIAFVIPICLGATKKGPRAIGLESTIVGSDPLLASRLTNVAKTDPPRSVIPGSLLWGFPIPHSVILRRHSPSTVRRRNSASLRPSVALVWCTRTVGVLGKREPGYTRFE